MKDGIVLMYCKDNILYPVALTLEQDAMIQMIVPATLGTVKVIDAPQGSVVDLKAKGG